MTLDSSSIISQIGYKTGSPADREGEFTLVVELDGRVHLLHRAFIHQTEWFGQLAPSVWNDLVTELSESSILQRTSVTMTGVPGTIVSRASWRIGTTTHSALLGNTPGEIAFQKLAHQIISQVGRDLLELGPWETDRTLVLASHAK